MTISLMVITVFMKKILCILSLTISTIVYGQTPAEPEIISTFKNDLLQNVEMFKPDTLNTSTAMLTRERFSELRCITTFPKNIKQEIVEYFFNDTKILESINIYDSINNPVGLTKKYNKKGQLEYVIDYDKGIWSVENYDNYPHLPILQKIKHRVDSLLISTYGQQFFIKNIIWSPDKSCFYNSDGTGANWTDYFEWNPKTYMLCYSIKLSENEIYYKQIEINLDSSGQIIFPSDNYDDIKGFEKTITKKGFVLLKQEAIKRAKRLGLIENDSIKAFTFLDWEYHKNKKKTIYNGNFTYNVGINTKKITYQPSKGRNRIEYKYDVYVFNPWTGKFKNKQKMKSYDEWENDSGLSTELMPDK